MYNMCIVCRRHWLQIIVRANHSMALSVCDAVLWSMSKENSHTWSLQIMHHHALHNTECGFWWRFIFGIENWRKRWACWVAPSFILCFLMEICLRYYELSRNIQCWTDPPFWMGSWWRFNLGISNWRSKCLLSSTALRLPILMEILLRYCELWGTKDLLRSSTD